MDDLLSYVGIIWYPLQSLAGDRRVAEQHRWVTGTPWTGPRRDPNASDFSGNLEEFEYRPTTASADIHRGAFATLQQ